MRVNLSQLSESTALNGHVQPGPQGSHRILSRGYCLVLSGHFVTSFQLCDYTMNTEHLVFVTLETRLISGWMRGCADEQLWKGSSRSSWEHWLSTDSSGSMWSILAGAIVVIMVCSWYFLVGIYQYNSLKSRLCESAPSLPGNVSQAGSITSSANVDPQHCHSAGDGAAGRNGCALQNGWGVVVRSRKWTGFQWPFLWAAFGSLFSAKLKLLLPLGTQETMQELLKLEKKRYKIAMGVFGLETEGKCQNRNVVRKMGRSSSTQM